MKKKYMNEHTRDFLQSSDKTRVTQNKNFDWWMTRIAKRVEMSFAATLVCIALLVGFMVIKKQHTVLLPLSSVIVTGENNFTTQEDIEAILKDRLPLSFMDIDTDQVKSLIMELPWVTSVTVSKHWPGKIKVEVKEREPLMRWGDDKVIDAEGVVFKASHSAEIAEALMQRPRLIGPEEKSEQVLAGFKTFIKAFPDYKVLNVEAFELTVHNSWDMHLEKNVTVKFGKKYLDARAKRLAIAYKTRMLPDMDKIETIYLTYPQGFSVQWKAEGDRNGQAGKPKITPVILESI